MSYAETNIPPSLWTSQISCSCHKRRWCIFQWWKMASCNTTFHISYKYHFTVFGLVFITFVFWCHSLTNLATVCLLRAREVAVYCIVNELASSNSLWRYLADSCTLVSNIASRRRLRSAQRRHLDVPRYNRSTLGRRSFSVAGPTVWNLLLDDLRDQGCTESTFKQSLKTYFFPQH